MLRVPSCLSFQRRLCLRPTEPTRRRNRSKWHLPPPGWFGSLTVERIVQSADYFEPRYVDLGGWPMTGSPPRENGVESTRFGTVGSGRYGALTRSRIPTTERWRSGHIWWRWSDARAEVCSSGSQRHRGRPRRCTPLQRPNASASAHREVRRGWTAGTTAGSVRFIHSMRDLDGFAASGRRWRGPQGSIVTRSIRVAIRRLSVPRRGTASRSGAGTSRPGRRTRHRHPCLLPT